MINLSNPPRRFVVLAEKVNRHAKDGIEVASFDTQVEAEAWMEEQLDGYWHAVVLDTIIVREAHDIKF